MYKTQTNLQDTSHSIFEPFRFVQSVSRHKLLIKMPETECNCKDGQCGCAEECKCENCGCATCGKKCKCSKLDACDCGATCCKEKSCECADSCSCRGE